MLISGDKMDEKKDVKMDCPRKSYCVIVKYYNDRYRCVNDEDICWWINEGRLEEK